MDTVSSITSKRVEYQIEDEFARETKLDRDELPKLVSAFENDAGYITSAVSDLTNYYTRSEVYTKEEVDLKLSTKWTTKVVESLPTEGISESTIYFVPIPPSEQGDVSKGGDYYSEYIHVDGVWEMIGNTHVDLSDYYTKSDVDSLVEQGVAAERDARAEADSDIMDMIETTNQNLADEAVSRGVEDSAIRQVVGEVQAGLLEEASRASAAETGLGVRMESAEVHVANRQNPHEVTAEQVGLGNVTNVATTDTLIENSEQNITSGAVYGALEGKVDKQEGRGLSDENFTIEEKLKLEGLENYDDTEVRADVDDNKSAIETLNGDADVEGSVDNKIATALADVTSIKIEVVKELPEEGENGVIYFLPGSNTLEESNIYDEYVWMGGDYEKLGSATSTISLVDYYKKEQVDALVSVKADKDYVDDELEGKADKNIISDAPTADIADANYAVGVKADGTVTKTLWSKVWDWVKSKIQGNNFVKSSANEIDGWFTAEGSSSSGNCFVAKARLTQLNGGTKNEIKFGIGSGHNNRGIYIDDKSGSFWMIRTSDNDSTVAIESPKGLKVPHGIAANVTGKVVGNVIGNCSGAADSSNVLNVNNTEFKALGRLQFFQKNNDSTINPNAEWWSLLRAQHAGYANGFWQEIAMSFASDSVYFRRNNNGSKGSWKKFQFYGDVIKIPTSQPSTLEDGMIWLA